MTSSNENFVYDKAQILKSIIDAKTYPETRFELDNYIDLKDRQAKNKDTQSNDEDDDDVFGLGFNPSKESRNIDDYDLAILLIQADRDEKLLPEVETLITAILDAELEKGNGRANLVYGDLYTNDRFSKKDYDQALKYYEDATLFSEANAYLRIGKIYYKGIGKEIDYKRAFDCFQKAVASNSIQAEIYLMDMFYHGHYIKQDLEFALTTYKRLYENYENDFAYRGVLAMRLADFNDEYPEVFDISTDEQLQYYNIAQEDLSKLVRYGYPDFEEDLKHVNEQIAFLTEKTFEA